MASRFAQRDARSSLFSGYDESRARGHSHSPYRTTGHGTESFGAYPAGNAGQFRVATPNRKGQYSDAVLNELESQNEDQLEGMSAKVKMLKDITSAIGDEIRDSTALAEKMNDSFEGTRLRLKGTMNRMLRMAEKTGVGWKAWLAFFTAVLLIFSYVWLF